MNNPDLNALLARVADALERLAPAPPAGATLTDADAFIWHPDGARLQAVPEINRIDLKLLRGINRQAETLLANTRRFARGLPANNALLWGARGMIENERSTTINPAEAVEERVSLSDRFGLWLGFHSCDQPTYMAIVEGYAQHFGLDIPSESLRARANEWSMTRGGRSGRVAWQFIQDLAGELGKRLDGGK